MDNLSGLAVFVRVAENLSYSAAGRSLGVSASAVGKSMARLETRLGVRLLHCSTRQITLTDEGAIFFERSESVKLFETIFADSLGSNFDFFVLL
ncbi:DNA-binding transcriptional LysR family regulator [Oxalobacteraceae bacterium GrIS 1.11]